MVFDVYGVIDKNSWFDCSWFLYMVYDDLNCFKVVFYCGILGYLFYMCFYFIYILLEFYIIIFDLFFECFYFCIIKNVCSCGFGFKICLEILKF